MTGVIAHRFPLVSMLSRIACYCVALLLIMFVSGKFFSDAYTASLSLFTLFAFTFEMLWAHRTKGPRLWCYLGCVACIAISGLSLVSHAMQVKAGSHEQRVFTSRLQDAVSNVEGAVIITNEDAIIKAVNQGVLELSGYTRDELLGKPVSFLLTKAVAYSQVSAGQTMRLNGDRGWVIRGREKVNVHTKSGAVVPVYQYVVGVRRSVDSAAWSEDVQFITIFVNEK